MVVVFDAIHGEDAAHLAQDNEKLAVDLFNAAIVCWLIEDFATAGASEIRSKCTLDERPVELCSLFHDMTLTKALRTGANNLQKTSDQRGSDRPRYSVEKQFA